VHLVTRGHFRSRGKDGGHTIQSVIAENPMLCAKFTALCFIEPDLLLIEVLHCRNRVFRPFIDWLIDLLIYTYQTYMYMQTTEIWDSIQWK